MRLGECSARAMNQCWATPNIIIHAPLQNNTWFVWIFYYRVWHREGSIPWGIGATSRGPPLAPGSVSRSFRTRSHTPRSEPKIDTLYDPPSLSSFWGPTIVPKWRYRKGTHHPVPKCPQKWEVIRWAIGHASGKLGPLAWSMAKWCKGGLARKLPTWAISKQAAENAREN